MTDNKDNQITLEDNSDRPMSESENKENVQEGAPQKQEGGAWYSKPEEFGSSIGGKIEDTLSPVGKHAGPVLEKGAGPIGAVVDPLVGGIMKGGKGWGETLGVGYGNAEGGPAKQQEAEHARMKEDLGGKEQTGDNPLGL